MTPSFGGDVAHLIIGRQSPSPLFVFLNDSHITAHKNKVNRIPGSEGITAVSAATVVRHVTLVKSPVLASICPTSLTPLFTDKEIVGTGLRGVFVCGLRSAGI